MFELKKGMKVKTKFKEEILYFNTVDNDEKFWCSSKKNKTSNHFLENKDIPFQTIIDNFSDAFNVIHCTVPSFGDDSGELSVVGVNKASAIEALINHLNIPQENTFAFGDGMNDADMLEYCHIGIAVGNAKEGLKAIADEVCDDIAEDGIYKTMKKYQLI